MVSRVPTALLGAFISITLIKAERQDLSLPSGLIRGEIKLNRDVEEVRTVEKQMKYYHRTKDEGEEERIGEVVRKKRELDRLVKREPSRRDDGRKEENKKKGVKNQSTEKKKKKYGGRNQVESKITKRKKLFVKKENNEKKENENNKPNKEGKNKKPEKKHIPNSNSKSKKGLGNKDKPNGESKKKEPEKEHRSNSNSDSKRLGNKDKANSGQGKSHKKKKPASSKQKDKETPLVKMNSGLVVSSSQCKITIDLNYGDSAFLYSINDGTRVRYTHIFQSPSGTKISLNCLQFNLHRRGCRKERMAIHPGKNRDRHLRACTVESPSLMTPSNTLKIRYDRNKGVHSGGYVCTADVIGDPTNPTPTTCVPGKRLFCDDACGTATITVPTKIVGGKEATIAEYPWQVLIEIYYPGSDYPKICGGSIIKKAWVLTAAHCFFIYDPETKKQLQITSIVVTFREHDVLQTDETKSFKIEVLDTDLYIHECYMDGITFEHDIAIIYLDETLDFAPDIRPICMPTAQDFTAGQEVLATGWGKTDYDELFLANTLQEVALNTVSMEECKTLNNNAQYPEFLNENMICTYTLNKDVCKGDSGGPLITNSSDGRWVQLGIVSFGYGCAEENLPAVYTNLAKYMLWITNITTTTDC